jgi:hypothetical protein
MVTSGPGIKATVENAEDEDGGEVEDVEGVEAAAITEALTPLFFHVLSRVKQEVGTFECGSWWMVTWERRTQRTGACLTHEGCNTRNAYIALFDARYANESIFPCIGHSGLNAVK